MNAMMTAERSSAELTRIVELGTLAEEPLRVTIFTSAAERGTLCMRLELIELSELDSEVTITRRGPTRVRVDAKLAAVVVQSCVITLEPVPATVEESFTQEFVYATSASDGVANGKREVWVEPGDEPEVLTDDRLDVGELVTQILSLALDPYPRKQGASFVGVQTGENAPTTAFAALAELKIDAARKRN